MLFRQCLLRKEDRVLTTWIPDSFASVGKLLKLKNDNGEWDDGWKVVETYNRVSEKEVIDNSRDFMRQRKASDI